MSDLRRKLAAGLTYEQYVSELHGVRRAYDAIPAAGLRLGCLLAAGTAGERALNLYTTAANEWGGCLTTASCTSAQVEPALQRWWTGASHQLSAARAGLYPARPAT